MLQRPLLPHRTASFVLASAVALASAWSLPAWADPPAAQEVDAETEAGARADAYFRQGKALVHDGDLEAARRAYLAGFELKQGYDIAGNLGNVELELGLPRDAAEHLAQCVRTFPATGTPKQLQLTRQRLAAARGQVGALSILVNVDGAEVFVDGLPIGRTPFADDAFVVPGTRVVEARAPGYAPVRRTVEATRGSWQAVALSLPLAATPRVQEPVAAPATLLPTTTPAGERRRPLGPLLAGAGLGALGLGLGIGGLTASNAAASRATREMGLLDVSAAGGTSACARPANQASCAALDGDYRARGAYRVVSIVGFTAAGVAAIGSLTYALVPLGNGKTAGPTTGTLGVGPSGIAWTGRFR